MPRGVLAWAVGLFVLLSTGNVSAKPYAFRLDVTPSSGGLDDTFIATVTLELATVGGYDEYRVPGAPDFLIKDTQIARTQSVAFTNGKRTVKSVETRRYFMRAKRPGSLAVGPAELLLNGRTYRTQRVVLAVKASGKSPRKAGTHKDPTAGGVGVPGFYPPEPATRSEMFLHVVLDKSEAYLGEQVTVTWLLYTQTDVLKFEPDQPRLDNMWSETLYEPNNYFRYHRTRVGGVPYEVAVVSKRAVFPLKSGVLEVPAFAASVTTMQTSLAGPQRILSKSAWLRVKPLPPNPPAGFDDTFVGRFEVSAEVDRKRLKAGDAFTTSLTISGTGALRRTTPPRFSLSGFRFRAPRDFDEKMQKTGDVISGSRTYRYWTSPQRGGAQNIPAIRLPYFDPVTGRYAVAETKPIAIYVSGDPAASLGGATVGAGVVARAMRPARNVSSITARSTTPVHQTSWFWILALVPMLGFIGVVVFERVRAGGGEPNAVRRRPGSLRARKRLRRATVLARDGAEHELYAELARLLHDQLEARTGKSGRGMRRDELARHMDDQGYPSPTITSLVDELDRFDAARFAPVEATSEEMQAAIERTRELLRQIETTPTEQTSGEGA